MLEKILNRFKKPKEYTVDDLIRSPDAKNYWGNSINFDKKDFTKIWGHRTPCIKNGDVFSQRMESGKIGVFKVRDVENCENPRDMFFATAEFMHYLTSQTATK